MVNIGKRSRCCFLCRDRRVKCDLLKPYCLRCKQAGRPCPGYPDPWDTVLRIQNNQAENQVQTRVQNATKARKKHASRKFSMIQKPVQISAETSSWLRFYQDYIASSDITLFQILPRFYESGASPCFYEGLHDVTLVSAAQQSHQSKLMIPARRYYGKAIVALNVALSNHTTIADDSVLVTLFLLSLFEMIVPEDFVSVLRDAEFQCHVHFRGILTLLRWRAEQGRDSELDADVLKFFSHICFMSIFLNNKPFDAKWAALERFTAPWRNDPLLESILHQTIEFKRRFHYMTTKDVDLSSAEILGLVGDGFAISQSLNDTSNTTFASQQTKAFNNLFDISNARTEAITRCLYQTVRFHVIELISSLISFGDSDQSTLGSDSEFDQSLRPAIYQQICKDIDIVLGHEDIQELKPSQAGVGYEAYCMFWPLIVLLYSSSADDERTWICNKLKRIGRLSGLGIATLAADSIHAIKTSK